MKRSEINHIYRQALSCFRANGWHLPPNPRWDVTDFGLGDFERMGLTLVNLAEEPEYCEKLMYARKNQETPAHAHLKKKEDIICRQGELHFKLWAGHPDQNPEPEFEIQVNNELRSFKSGDILKLKAGERLTLVPGIYHAFWPETEECIIGEVSTANDDLNDNFFVRDDMGRFPEVEEDEAAEVRLVSD